MSWPSRRHPGAAGAARPCRVCGGAGEHRLTTTDRNREIGRERFDYHMCGGCATLYLANEPRDLGRYYPPDYYPLGDEAAAGATERAKLELLRRFAPGDRLIEVGPGAGGFAVEARAGGFAVRAIEMDEAACSHLRAMAIETVHSAAPHEVLLGLAPSHVIVLWHVFEHLAEPVALLRAAAANLDPGGVLVLAVPNPDAFQLRLLGARWPHIDAPRHLQLVPAGTLVRLAVEAGLVPLALTACDRMGRDWNVFGWQHVLVRLTSTPARRRAAFYVAAVLAELLAPVERRGLRGSTYTAVFRKDEGT